MKLQFNSKTIRESPQSTLPSSIFPSGPGPKKLPLQPVAAIVIGTIGFCILVAGAYLLARIEKDYRKEAAAIASDNSNMYGEQESHRPQRSIIIYLTITLSRLRGLLVVW